MTTSKQINGLLISFEGIEGSGKSTQIQAVKEYYENQGHKVLLLREPGGTVFGEGLRQQILSSKTPISPIAEAYLFAASRAQLLSEKIIPFLQEKNNIVILDRYFDSSVAYQGYARELGAEFIIDIHKVHPLNIWPQKTFYLKIDLETSHKRQKARGNAKDYFEKESMGFYQKLIEGYNYCANKFTDRIVTIDASQSVDEVKQSIIEHL